MFENALPVAVGRHGHSQLLMSEPSIPEHAMYFAQLCRSEVVPLVGVVASVPFSTDGVQCAEIVVNIDDTSLWDSRKVAEELSTKSKARTDLCKVLGLQEL